MKSFWIVIAVMGFVFLALLLAGCVSVGETNPESTLPANRPASWDGTTLGVPI